MLKPIKLVLSNIPAGETIACHATNNPQDENPTVRQIVLTREVFIESDDFAEVPPPKYFRLKPGGEVRLKYACIIKCDELVKDAGGFGASPVEAFSVLRAAGGHALPLPLGETMLAGLLLAKAGIAIPSGPISVPSADQPALRSKTCG